MARLILDKILNRQKPVMTKYRFSKLLGLQPQNVLPFFKAGYNPKLQTLADWAAVLNCKVSDLYDEKKDRPKTSRGFLKRKRKNTRK